MSVIKVYSKFGEVEVEPLTLVQIQPSADAEDSESIINSDSNREHQA